MILITPKNVVQFLQERNCILLQPVFKSNGEKYWRLATQLRIQLSNGRIITIPEGFETDISSAPKFLWWICPPFGDFNIAAIIHDWLYVDKPYGIHIKNRKFADDEMLFWSNIVNSNGSNRIRYFAVRWFGAAVWNQGIKNRSHLRYK